MPLGAYRINSIARFVVTAEAEVIRRKIGITAIGNAQVDTAQSKFGGASALFDGTGDYLTVAAPAEFAFGTGNFTVECWFRRTGAISTQNIIFDFRSTSTNHFLLYWKNTNRLEYYDGGSTYTGPTILAADNWYHVAVQRSGTAFKIYLNGAEEISQTNSRNHVAQALNIGHGRGTPTTGGLNGHIDEFRISNIARYTSNFTPSTTAFVNDENTLLLMHMDGTDTSTYFEDDNGVPGTLTSVRTGLNLTAYADAQVDTAQSKFGGASALFDGSGDYLEIVGSESILSLPAPGSNRTIEFWIRPDNVTSTRGLIGKRPPGGSNSEWQTWITSTGKIQFVIWRASNTTDVSIIGATTLSVNTWYHVALVRNSTTWKLYLNGTEDGTATSVNTPQSNSSTVLIARDRQFTPTRDYDGYIDEVRVSDIARYTTAFTPPASAFVNDSNTLLLLHMDGTDGSTTFTDDTLSITGRKQIGVTAFGNAQVDTAQSKFGGASYLGDGTDDGLVTGKDDNFIFSGDFTWECWIRAVDLGNTNTTVIMSNRGSFSTTNLHLLWRGTDEKIQWGTSGSGALLSASALSYNTWYHLAIVRSSGVMKLYIDGVAEATTFSYSGNIGTTSDNFITVGRISGGAGTEFNGNIDEVRVSDIARYTSNFTPSTTPFVNDSNTLLLLHMDGTDGSTVFFDDNGVTGSLSSVRTAKTVTAINNAQVDTAQSKFGGASALYDGNGDNLAMSQQFDIGTNNFTLEGWFRINFLNAYRALFDIRNNISTDQAIYFGLKNTNVLYLYYNGSIVYEGTSTISATTWYHIALVKHSGTTKIYINGVADGSYSDSNNYGNNKPCYIGAAYNNSGSWNGNIDEIRISDIARYTANFTPPAQAFVNDSNTLLLLHMDGTDASTTFTDDTLSITGRTQVGVAAFQGAQVDTAQSKFGGSSLLLGFNPYLDVYNTELFQWGSSADFTYEGWMRSTTSPSDDYIFDSRTAGNSTHPMLYVAASPNQLRYYTAGASRISVTWDSNWNNVWTHWAVVRHNGTTTLYVDGTSRGSFSDTFNYGLSTKIRIANWHGSSTPVNGFPGHMDEFRISNTARYTSNFTPSTTPFQNDSNTLLLLHMDGTDASTTFRDDNGVTPDWDYGA